MPCYTQFHSGFLASLSGIPGPLIAPGFPYKPSGLLVSDVNILKNYEHLILNFIF